MKCENQMELTFPSQSRNEGFARAAVAAFAAQLDPNLDELGDIKTAVSEAVTNCIVHAYRDTIGTISLKCRILPGSILDIIVKDRGCGIADVAQASIDPVGVHTGDSIVVAPSQTLSDKEYQMLRTSALKIINELQITGGCNVQFALHPTSFEYCVIEVNPRVSRSSALASKATGYPIAKVAAKIALGFTLDEIKNAITHKTYASFEPTLDYCVVKIPRLPFDKFITAKRTLTTQMKATGEVMSICNNFEGALMKAIRSLEQHVDCLRSYDFSALSVEELLERLKIVDDQRIYKRLEQKSFYYGRRLFLRRRPSGRVGQTGLYQEPGRRSYLFKPGIRIPVQP